MCFAGRKRTSPACIAKLILDLRADEFRTRYYVAQGCRSNSLAVGVLMQISDVYLVTERVKRVPTRSLDALEKALGAPLPLGYREYLIRLGVGRFSGFLNIYAPQNVKEHLGWWRETRAEVIIDGIEVGMYSRGGLSNKKVREAFLFGRTDNGDQFISTPACGQALFVVPRSGPSIRKLRHGFSDPIACCRAVNVNDVQPWFEAQNGRRR